MVRYYDRDRIPKKKICPFADARRVNPCTSHNKERSRKDLIQRHLQAVLRHNGDAQHPIDDPLWESWEVKDYWLAYRLDKIEDTELRKQYQRLAQKRCYRKRVRKQDELEAEFLEKFERGEIGADEYKRILVGAKRRKFDMEQELERKVKERCAKLSLLAQGNLVVGGSVGEIAELNREMLPVAKTRTAVSSEDLEFPSTAGVDQFYQFAALLLPFETHNPRANQQEMKKLMRLLVKDLIADHKVDHNPDSAVTTKYDSIVHNLDRCCDLINEEERKRSSMDEESIQLWLDEQNRIWNSSREVIWKKHPPLWRSPVYIPYLTKRVALLERQFLEIREKEPS
jgi:hypothetical protein